MKRVALLLALLCAYGLFMAGRSPNGGVSRLDPVSPQAREVERAIAAGRFAHALPIATELRNAHPDEALPELWLSVIHRGLDRPGDELDAWERFIDRGKAAAEACPGLAESAERARGRDEGLRAYERCARLDPDEPERLIDLGKALEGAGRDEEALAAYQRAGELAPGHPVAADRVHRLSRKSAEGR